jgi:sulfide:quinone oxidoreductase
MVGRRRRDQIERPLHELLAPGVELVEAEVRSIDPVARRVETTARVLEGDSLVIALGAEPDRDAVPGYREAVLDFFSPDGATAAARALDSFEGGRVVMSVAALPYKCPAAPYEAALLLDDELRRRGIRENSEIDVYSPEPAPMPVAGPVMGAAVVGSSRRGIRFHPGSRVERFEPGSREIVFADGSRAGYDLLAGVPPHRAPAVVRGSAVAGDTGWIPVDRGTLETRHERVHAIGDVTTITLTTASRFRAPACSPAMKVSSSPPDRRVLAGARPRPHSTAAAGSRPELDARPSPPAVLPEPDPTLVLRAPGGRHAGKVLFERSWIGVGWSGDWPTGLVVSSRLAGLR